VVRNNSRRSEGDLTEVERLATDVIELSTRHSFAHRLAGGEILRGWTRSAHGSTEEGIAGIEDGIAHWRATGSMLIMPFHLTLRAHTLSLAGRIVEALQAIKQAEAVVERPEER
jgi:predicted ATPase